MLGLQHVRSTSPPFSSQSARAPFALVCDCSEQRDGEWVEVEFVQDLVDEIRSFGIPVYSMERVAGGIDRQRWDVNGLAVGGNSGYAGCNA